MMATTRAAKAATAAWYLTAVALAVLPVFPEPPMPPAHPPTNEHAPVPNNELQRPTLPGPGSGSRVGLKLYRLERPDNSQGFAPGSRYQVTDERWQSLIPGFQISVPLTPP